MSEQPSLFERIGQWIKAHRPNGQSASVEKQDSSPSIEHVETRPLSIFRPFAKRDAAIAGLQQAFSSLTDLMGTIRENLERQSQRQDEILSHLAHLPEVFQSLPEATRAQGETLKAIGEQLEQQLEQQLTQQAAHQARLAEILSKVSDASADQKQILQSLSERVQTVDQHNKAIAQHNEAIADSLRQVGSTMADMGRNAESSAKVLEQVRTCIDTRDSQMQQIIEKQNQRFTTMLIVAISLAGASLLAVVVIGILLLARS